MKGELQDLYEAHFKGLLLDMVHVRHNEFQVTIQEDGKKGWLAKTVFGLTPEGIGPPLFIATMVWPK